MGIASLQLTGNDIAQSVVLP